MREFEKLPEVVVLLRQILETLQRMEQKQFSINYNYKPSGAYGGSGTTWQCGHLEELTTAGVCIRCGERL